MVLDGEPGRLSVLQANFYAILQHKITCLGVSRSSLCLGPPRWAAPRPCCLSPTLAAGEVLQVLPERKHQMRCRIHFLYSESPQIQNFWRNALEFLHPLPLPPLQSSLKEEGTTQRVFTFLLKLFSIFFCSSLALSHHHYSLGAVLERVLPWPSNLKNSKFSFNCELSLR